MTEFTEEEIEILKEVAESQKRWSWAAGVLRRGAVWITVVVGGIYVVWNLFADAVKRATH